MGSRNGGVVSALVVRLIAALTVIFIAVIGIGLGLSLAQTANIKNQENFVEFAPALPTKILDINGTLVTEFASDEKRELVSLSELPRHLIHAVLAREDPDFYNHRGFSIRGISRAVLGELTGKNLGGGSTITQQVAGTLYTNRSERTIKRKIKELWWAFQIERRYTKNEILEIYLNYMPMGPGTYGVETASKYFFGHSASDVDLAESAVLAVLLSGPSRFNPLNNPNEARDRQHYVLERMIQFGYADEVEAEASYNEYWSKFDWTRPSLSAYYSREDKAPWFSEYVRRELEVLMYGTRDYYRDGYVVHTTLDLRHQEKAEELMAAGLERANREYLRSGRSSGQAERAYRPIVNLLTLAFNLTDIRNAGSGQNEIRSVNRYTKVINPVVDMAALVFNIPDLKEATEHGFEQLKTNTEQNVVEGALISIENETGYITAIVGGSKYDESNQLIRATQGNIQPGSAFKPLYYSAAIDTRQFTASTLIYDVPIVFHNEDGTPYIPLNFRDEWKGPVLLYNALAQSMNVPSLKVLDAIGFDAAIDRAAALLDITDSAQIRRTFPRVYPLGLGIISTSPLRMARAFAVFGNQGREVTPIAIRTVEDRNGRIVFDIERDVRQRHARMGNNVQVVSQQNAYIMTKILEKTVEEGTLRSGSGFGSKFTFQDENGRFRIPVAGKTGTPQNWSDAWAVGYSPYYTTAVWFGFDRPGNSLGLELTGATLAGPVWGDYMSIIHKGLPRKNFTRPATGIIDVSVCTKSGLLRNAFCNEGEVTLPFIVGSQPSRLCDYHQKKSPYEPNMPISTIAQYEDPSWLVDLPMPKIDWDQFPELRNSPQQRNSQSASPRGNTNNRNTQTNTQPSSSLSGNPFLDDDAPAVPPRSNTPPPAGQSEPFVSSEPAVVPNREEESSSDLPSWNPLD